MALSLKRFVAWGGVGAAAIVAAASASLSSRYSNLSNFYDRPSLEPGAIKARNARLGLRPAILTLEVHDSIARALRLHPPTPGISVVLPSVASAAARRATDSIARDIWRRLVGSSQIGSTVVLTVGDSAQNNAIVGSYDSRRTFLPTGLDGRTCIILVGLGQAGSLTAAQRVPRQDTSYARSLEVASSSCAWFAKYGMPGPRIREWLDDERWVPTWTVAASDTEPLRVKSRITGFRSMWYSGGVTPWFQRNGVPYFPATERLACIGGIDARCAPSLREGTAGSYSRNLLPAYIPRVGWGWTTPLHATTLAYLERELGREKFLRFWTSPDEVEQALETLGGAAVLQRSLWHDVERYHVSPWPSGYEWPLLLALLIVPPGMMVLRSRRRFLAR